MFKKILFIVSLLLPLIIVCQIFRGVSHGQFIYAHDELLLFGKQEILDSFYIIDPTNLGSANSTSIIVTFFDRAYYFYTHMSGLSVYYSEVILYYLKLVLIILIPAIGFKKISSLISESKKISDLQVLLISLWYGFNIFTLIYWNGNAFSLTLLICYVLAPLALYHYHRGIFEGGLRNLLIDALLMFLMSFALYFFAVYLLFIFIYTLLYFFLNKLNFKVIISRTLRLITIFLPFSVFYVVMFYDMFTTSVSPVDITGGATYGWLGGSFLYQIMMWFSWGIYRFWTPRNIFTFDSYFRTFPSLVAPFIIYGLILLAIFKNKVTQYLLIFLSTLLFFLFFIKGAQNPFGGVYLFFINHFYFFRLFRSPDSKFGFGVVFSLALLLVLISKYYREKTFSLLIAFVILIQGFLIFNGTAIRGQNTATSSDRIISIPKDYRSVAKFLNSSKQFGYVFLMPSVQFGIYHLYSKKLYIGQNLIQKITDLPFLYYTVDSGLSLDAYSELSSGLKNSNLNILNKFPIEYILLQNDTVAKRDKILVNQIREKLQLVYHNTTFEVYKNANHLPMLQSKNMKFTMVSPAEYILSFSHVKENQPLYFYQNYNKNWVLISKSYPGLATLTSSTLLNSSHNPTGYANMWEISPRYIIKHLSKKDYTLNKDGSFSFNLKLYFKTQALFTFGLIIAAFYSVILLVLVFSTKISASKRLQ